ncbi:MAG: GMC family oxidoreductase N-terminal domain-containing protein [Coriobacteriales bacterium]|jgi:choline dehydrogenase|nr:GMC family oxidoreductase N-terminal domain-containing protein [Coriobacteriales bacterium]
MSHHAELDTHHEKTFDYLVIGTGPAGSVIANRLSADGSNSVLVLEAGANSDRDPIIRGSQGTMGKYPEYYWPELIKEQVELPGLLLPLGGGRLAGGGSSVNYEIYVRPTPPVLRAWELAAGSQWSLEHAVRRYKLLENFEGAFADNAFHGHDGRLRIRQANQNPPPFVKALGQALEEGCGHALIEDYNDPRTPIGPYFRAQLYQKPNTDRASASVCFLGDEVTTNSGKGIKGHDLQVLYEATATKILFDDERRARQVEYLHKGVCYRAAARKKVIVCCGIRSAKLLMLSGIGKASELEALGIPVVFDNPAVGSNLINDAVVASMVYVGPEPLREVAPERATMQCGAFLPNPLPGERRDHRALQIITMVTGEMMQIILILVDTKSRGSLTLQSADPLKAFLSDEGFLSSADDIAVLQAGLRSYVKPTVDALAKNGGPYRLVDLSEDVLADDARLDSYIRQHFSQAFHEQGALRMGKLEEGAVVDGWGGVYGVNDLIVADTSIIPHHMDGNTSASSYLIGATVAEHLLSP